MQIKNIILSLAAAVALVQAAPAPAPETADCPKSLYDVCLEETANILLAGRGKVPASYPIAYANCGYCVSTGVGKCGPQFVYESVQGVEQIGSKDCYKKAMDACKADLDFYTKYLALIPGKN